MPETQTAPNAGPTAAEAARATQPPGPTPGAGVTHSAGGAGMPRVALMSIRPQFADRILRGEKKVEFRRRRIADDVAHVVVYATSPARLVVGSFSVSGQHTAHPRELWEGFQKVAGLTRDEFDRYFDDCARGTAIVVGQVTVIDKPKGLDETLGIRRAPQSFLYLTPDRAARLIPSGGGGHLTATDDFR